MWFFFLNTVTSDEKILRFVFVFVFVSCHFSFQTMGDGKILNVCWNVLFLSRRERIVCCFCCLLFFNLFVHCGNFDKNPFYFTANDESTPYNKLANYKDCIGNVPNWKSLLLVVVRMVESPYNIFMSPYDIGMQTISTTYWVHDTHTWQTTKYPTNLVKNRYIKC